MKLTKEQVEKLAHLARLKLTDDEIERLSGELTDILDYVEMLGELDTDGVPETAQVTGLSNVVRKDEIDDRLCNPEDLLDTSPLPVSENQIKIKKMM